MLMECVLEKRDRGGTGGTMDAHDYTEFDSVTRYSLGIYAMIQDATYMASYLAQLNNPAGVGRKREYAHQKLAGRAKLKLIMERSIGNRMETAAETAPNTPYSTRGGFRWIQNGAQQECECDVCCVSRDHRYPPGDVSVI